MVGCQAGPGILKRAKNVDVYWFSRLFESRHSVIGH
jgi:hypothetical protein